MDASGKVHITLVNIDPIKAQTVNCDLRGINAKTVTGKALSSAKINDFNSFEKPNTVTVKDFKSAKLSKDNLSVELPAKSVVMLELK
jgi:alpha-N-arabinofuranosidase